jgi:hypothetical protein
MTLHACLCELQQIPSELPSARTKMLEPWLFCAQNLFVVGQLGVWCVVGLTHKHIKTCGPTIEVLSSWHGITTL